MQIPPLILITLWVELFLVLGATAEDKYSLVFMARGGGLTPPSPGHTWVAWAAEDSKSQSCTIEGFGFHPKGKGLEVDLKAITLTPQKGILIKEALTSVDKSPDETFVIAVTKAAYDQSRKRSKDWIADRPKYQLLTSDCVAFAEKVAIAAGLTTPPRVAALTPLEFVRALKKENGK